jgi:hypothetical protein
MDHDLQILKLSNIGQRNIVNGLYGLFQWTLSDSFWKLESSVTKAAVYAPSIKQRQHPPSGPLIRKTAILQSNITASMH